MRLPWPFRRELQCRHAIELMSAYLDGQLPTSDRERLEHHFEGCPECIEYLAQLRITITATGKIKADALSDQALDDLVAVYRRWCEEP